MDDGWSALLLVADRSRLHRLVVVLVGDQEGPFQWDRNTLHGLVVVLVGDQEGPFQ